MTIKPKIQYNNVRALDAPKNSTISMRKSRMAIIINIISIIIKNYDMSFFCKYICITLFDCIVGVYLYDLLY